MNWTRTASQLSLFLLLLTSTAQAIPLFKITYGVHISYVLGTAHDFPAEKLPNAIHHLVSRSRVLLVETTATEVDYAEVLKTDSERDNKKLFSTLEWLKLKRLLKSVQLVSVERFRHLRPAGAYAVLEQAFADSQALKSFIPDAVVPNFEGTSMDLMIQQWAAAAAIPVQGLDRKPLPPPTEGELVNYVRSFFRSGADQATRPAPFSQLEAYQAWSPAHVENKLGFQVHARGNPLLVRAVNRHAEWFADLKAEFQEGGAFVAVGLAHVIPFEYMDYDAESLLDRLMKEGFVVSFVNCEEYLM